MFHTPPQTLQSVLRKLLEQPRQYVADVCFEYPQGKIYAHRAIILARAPQAFTNKYLSRLVLDATSCRAGVTLYSTPIVPYGIMEQLLRFWYTAEFSLPPSTEHKSSSSAAASSYPSSLSLTSTQSTLSSSLATDQFDLMERSEIIKSIQEHEHYLGVPLLALTSEDPMERLVADIRAMYEQHLAADVVVHIPNTTTATSNAGNETINNNNNNMTQQQHSFPIHRCILAAQSSYFYGMFCKDFSEATSPTVHLPGDIFSAPAFRVILSYYYHINTTRLYLPRDQHHQISLARKKQMLRLLHDAFRGADYMSPNETVCTAILDAMASLFRGQYKCVCNDCVALLPFMWWFADQYKTQHKACAALRSSLLTLYTDQPQSIVLLWPSKYFAVLLDYAPSYVNELESHVDIKKQTAVQWLEHLYMCLNRIRGSSGNMRMSPTTSNHPALPVIHRLMDSAVQMISDDFCFYCFEYPILLSYVDKVVASSAGRRCFPRQPSKQNAAADFMEFLLTRVVQQGMNDLNAGEIYQGIVRDLVGRLEAIDDHPALLDAKNESTAYLSKRWLQVKAHGGFSKLDRDVLKKLSEDIDVPYRNLTKSIDSRIKHWFGSKRLSSTFTNKKEIHRHSLSGAIGFTQSRLSFTGFGRHSHDTFPRTTTASDDGGGRETPQSPRQQNEIGSNFTLVASTTPITVPSSTSPSPSLPALPISPSSFMDALLPPEPIVDESSDCDTTRSSSATPVSRTTNNGTPKRESRLRFELPDIPPRSPPPTPSIVRTASMVSSRCAPDTHAGSPIAINKLRRRRRRRSASPDPASLSPIAKLGHWWRHSWLLHSNADEMDNNNDHEQEKQNEKPPVEPVLGAKVELLRRPLPMRGTIRYIGEVHFALGTYVGVELEDRLGSNDGSVEGHRYFHTNTQRGTFCKIDDFKIISLPPQHS